MTIGVAGDDLHVATEVRTISQFDSWLDECSAEQLDEFLSVAIADEDEDKILHIMAIAQYKKRYMYRRGA